MSQPRPVDRKAVTKVGLKGTEASHMPGWPELL